MTDLRTELERLKRARDKARARRRSKMLAVENDTDELRKYMKTLVEQLRRQAGKLTDFIGADNYEYGLFVAYTKIAHDIDQVLQRTAAAETEQHE